MTTLIVLYSSRSDTKAAISIDCVCCYCCFSLPAAAAIFVCAYCMNSVQCTGRNDRRMCERRRRRKRGEGGGAYVAFCSQGLKGQTKIRVAWLVGSGGGYENRFQSPSHYRLFSFFFGHSTGEQQKCRVQRSATTIQYNTMHSSSRSSRSCCLYCA